MKPILKIENIFKDFSGLQVLLDVNLDVLEGERHALIGPNGAGKSTLFNIITGFYRPSQGKIFFLDKDTTRWPAHKIARMGLSRSFQITSIFPLMTVYENVRNAIVSKVGCRFNWSSFLNHSKHIILESDRIIDLLGLNEHRDAIASELSYGWQRRLELALTVARDPCLIMLDEPTAGIDVEATRAFIPLIRKVTEGKTLIIIEHDMDVVYNLADRITVLNNGEILTTGSRDEIRSNEEVQKAYLGRR